MSYPVPSDKTKRRYDQRSYMAAAGFVQSVVDFQNEVAHRGSITLDEIADVAYSGKSMERAHYYGGTRLDMEFSYDGRTYHIESDDEGTYFS